MRQPHILALAIFAALLLAGCGAYAPPAAPQTDLAARQTAVALAALPTLAALPAADDAGQAAPTPAPRPLPDVLLVADDDPRALGRVDAPVTIYEFTDFECPFCKQFVTETRPQLLAQFVDAGVVRIVARDYPLTSIHPSALIGAVAARCAAEQGRFWPMYEQLFATHQSAWGGDPARDHDRLIDLAAGVGVEAQPFRACMDDPATAQAVQDEAEAAGRLGVNSTPNFLINGQLVRGSLPLASFERLIRQLAGL